METHAFARSLPIGPVSNRAASTRADARFVPSRPLAIHDPETRARLGATSIAPHSARRAAVRRPHVNLPRVRVTVERAPAANLPSTLLPTERFAPVAEVEPIRTRPLPARRRPPFLTLTRLLLGRDGLAALSMTAVFAILLFL